MNKSKKTDRKREARILIVDDHPVVRRGTAELIADEPDLEVCGEAADMSDALRQLETTRPDLALIDISLKTGSGIELIKQAKARNDKIKMLVCSMHDEVLYAERCLRAGAMGYIMKQEDTDQLIYAIRRVLAGKIYLSLTMTDRLLKGLADRDQESGPSSINLLSDRELEVFEGIGEGLTTSQVAERLHLSIKTIEAYRENIKKKRLFKRICG